MKAIEFQEVSKRYGKDVWAVKSVTLDVEPGEFISLLGPSGCGKTTTLRLLAGFIHPTSGSITTFGNVISKGSFSLPPEKRGMGMVFQSYAVWPHKTVFENVAYGLRLRKLPRDEITTRVKQVLSMVELADLADRYPPQLSGGQQQRVALARSLAIEPRLLLMDEPLSNLDARLREVMRFEIKDIQERLGLTSVYVTHDQAEAMVMSSRIVVMKDGLIQQVGSPRDVYERPQNQFVASFIGVTNFLPGKVQELSPLHVELVNGSVIRTTSTVGLRRDQDVGVSVRPHHLQIVTEEDPRPGLTATLVRAVYLGPHLDCEVSISGLPGTYRSQLPADVTLRAGDAVKVIISPEQALALPQETAAAAEVPI